MAYDYGGGGKRGLLEIEMTEKVRHHTASKADGYIIVSVVE